MAQTFHDILDGLQTDGKQIVQQLSTASNAAYQEFLGQLKSVDLTDQQRSDIAFATSQLTNAGLLSVGANADMLAVLGQARLEALSILADIEAVKARDGENILKNSVAKALGIAQTFVLEGEKVLIAGLLAGV